MTRRVAIGISGFVALLFAGALLWARSGDPFERIWFTVKTQGHGKAKCIAIWPKMATRPLPVVVYLHGVGRDQDVLGDGEKLRRMAELGLAAVTMEYDTTNAAAFDAQFSALLAHVSHALWARTNTMAWVGNSRGANCMLSFALRHPDVQPQLLVQLAGGMVEELQNGAGKLHCSVLLLHGERDEVFPMAEAEQVVSALRSKGTQVEFRVLPGRSHNLSEDQPWVYRAMGEYCLTQLAGKDAWSRYQSIGLWRALARPLWIYWLPALLWGGAWGFQAWRVQRATRSAVPSRRRTRLETALGWAAAGLAVLAVGQTGLHRLIPRLTVKPTTVALARRILVQPKAQADFEFLLKACDWRGQRLKALLEHLELANYNRGLVSWPCDDEVFREYVLSPEIAARGTDGFEWRRALWESSYPRVRREQSTEAAAEIVGRQLRERLTLTPEPGSPQTVDAIWESQRTNPTGFERVYVAALRSVGVPARLDAQAQAEYWSGGAWRPAPRSGFTVRSTENQ